MREKLIELLDMNCGYVEEMSAIKLADHLLSNGITVQKWIPVAERLPEKDDRVLTWDGRNIEPHIYDAWKNKWVEHDENGYPYEVAYITHWMPLPEPPEEEIDHGEKTD